MSFDTIIRGGTVATAADTFACDVGIRGGKIVALGDDLGDGRRDRSTRAASWCCPAASTAMCTSPSRPAPASSWPTTSRAARAGGVRRQHDGAAVLPAAEGRRACARRSRTITPRPRANATSTSASTSSSPTRRDSVLGQELPALVEDGYTSFKVFMTYEDLALTDMRDAGGLDASRARPARW